jgi:putative phage-type endonuclease
VLTPAQRAARADTIGASDVPKLAGLSRFGGPISVYREKVEGWDSAGDSEAAEIGSEAEPLISRMYEKRTGKRLEVSATLTHPKYRWCTASPDRFVAGEPLPVELKNVGPHMVDAWDPNEEDGVPDDYRAQVIWQIGVTRGLGVDVREAHIAALLAGSSFRVFRVQWDQRFFDELLAIGWGFLSKHLRPKVPPPLDGTEESRAFLKARFPKALRPMIDAPIQSLAWAEELHAVRETIKAAKGREEELKTLFQSLIEDAAGLVGPWGEATWNANAQGNPSWKSVAEGLEAELASALSKPPTLDDPRTKAESVARALIEESRGEAARVFLFKYGKKSKATKRKGS